MLHLYKGLQGSKCPDTLRDQKLADMSCVGVALLMGRSSGDDNFYKLINWYKCLHMYTVFKLGFAQNNTLLILEITDVWNLKNAKHK